MTAANSFVEQLRPDDQLMVVAFDSDIRVRFRALFFAANVLKKQLVPFDAQVYKSIQLQDFS